MPFPAISVNRASPICVLCAHTIGFDAVRNTVYAFLPETHRAAVYLDLWESYLEPA